MKFRNALLTFIAVSAISATSLFAAQPEKFSFADFSGGLNSKFSSHGIKNNQVADVLNVLLDEDFGGVGRKGFTVCGSSKAYSYSAAWAYTDSSDINWLILRSSDTIIAANDSCTFDTIIATTTATDLVNAVNALGDIYFVDRTQGVYSWDGSVTTYVSGSPNGSIIEAFRGRVWVTGEAFPNSHLLTGSAHLDGTSWVTGTDADDAVQLQIGLLDATNEVTGLFGGYNDALTIFKESSIYGLYGFDQLDFQLRILNNEIGCVDERSIQAYSNNIIFASARGIEAFDGVNVRSISRPIDDKLDAFEFRAFNPLTWSQTTQAQFNDGFILRVDTFTSAGDITLTSREDEFSNIDSWTVTSSSGWSVSSGVSHQNKASGINVISGIKKTSQVDIAPNWRLKMTVRFSSNSTSTFPYGEAYAIESSTQGTGYGIRYAGAGFQSTDVSIMRGPGQGSTLATVNYSRDFDFHEIELVHSATGYIVLFVDGVSTATVSDTTHATFNNLYLEGFSEDPSENVIEFDSVILKSSTGTFYSAVHNADDLTSWSVVNMTSQDNGGSHIFFTRSSTTWFSVGSDTPTWISQTANALVAASTGTYFQLRDDFTVNAATEVPTLNDFKFSWFEGLAPPKMASTIFDDRYLLSITSNTDVSENDSTLVLSEGPIWTIFDIKAGAFVIYKGNLYHTNNEANGEIYTDFQGTNDAGTAITHLIRTKDYFLGDITQDKLFDSLYLMATPNKNFTISTQYFVDKSTTGYSLADLEVTIGGDGLVDEKLPFPIQSGSPNRGKFIAFEFSNSTLDEDFNVLGGVLIHRRRKTE